MTKQIHISTVGEQNQAAWHNERRRHTPMAMAIAAGVVVTPHALEWPDRPPLAEASAAEVPVLVGQVAIHDVELPGA
jgi:hypothetical protein